MSAKKAAGSAPAPARFVPGEIDALPGEIEINAGRRTVTITVANTGDRPIQVGSHYHFYETNDALAFDREAAWGCRLDIASGTAVRFEPGQRREVQLVEYAGDRQVYGFAGRVMGALDGKKRGGGAKGTAKGRAAAPKQDKPAGKRVDQPSASPKGKASTVPAKTLAQAAGPKGAAAKRGTSAKLAKTAGKSAKSSVGSAKASKSSAKAALGREKKA